MPGWTRTAPTTEGHYWFVPNHLRGPLTLLEVKLSKSYYRNKGKPELYAYTLERTGYRIDHYNGWWWPEPVQTPPIVPRWSKRSKTGWVFKPPQER